MKLELIRKKCIEANPSILDLEFGCEVMLRDSSLVSVICNISENEEGEKYVYTTYGATANKVYLKKKFEHDNYIKKIIGRPITLADVLMACDKIKISKPVDGYTIYPCLLIMDDKNTHPRAEWNLKEHLENQSEETIDFLYNLLN